MTTTRVLLAVIAYALLGACAASHPSNYGLEELSMDRYGKLQDDLDPVRFAEGYPALMRKLRSDDTAERCVALRTIGASDELDAIPFVVKAMLTTEVLRERYWAASALDSLVSHHELKRRDFERPTGVYLLPPTPSHIDLRPLAWVVEEMLAMGPDSGLSMHTATIVFYVDMKQFTDEVTAQVDSQQQARQDALRHMLEQLAEMYGDGDIDSQRSGIVPWQ